ncbi:MAG: glycoside hydrolase family 2, partial [Duncaniella sp.]|nr:glycoside hydrolase family 2 [Duncaniella sp.]
MRFTNFIISAAMLTAGLCLPSACSSHPESASIKTVEEGFMSPPDSIRIAVYWYWLNNNLSPEGVVKDLHAMKKAGITRAQIGMIGIDGLPNGDAPYDSELWWETLHQALKTAGELDIEIGIFNCPGWSQSGGPWIKPEQSMRHIVSAETEVTGPGVQTITLPAIEGECQDEAVIAWPAFVSEGYSQSWTLTKTEGQPLAQELKLDSPATVRSLQVNVSTPIQTEGVIKTRVDGEWKEVKRFAIDRYNAEANVGFDPYAPVIVSLPEAEVGEVLFEVAAPG